MQTPCQRILQSCLINLLGTLSNNYFSQFIPITKWFPQLTPHSPPNRYWSLIASLLISLLIQTILSIYMSYNTVTYIDDLFSPTEIPRVRHEQGGIGENFWKENQLWGWWWWKEWQLCQSFCISIPLLVLQYCRHFLPMPPFSCLPCGISVGEKSSFDVTLVFLVYMEKLVCSNSDINQEEIWEH